MASAIRRPGAGAWWQVLAALIWLPQAALLAWAVQRMADGQGVAQIAKNGTGCGITGTGQRVSAF